MRHLRILMLATTFPRWPLDKEPRFIFDLAKRVAPHVSLWLLAPHAPGAKFQEEMEGVRVIRFPYFYPLGAQTLCYEGGMLPKLKSSWRARLQLPFFLASFLWHIRRAVKEHRINFIHCHWIVPQGIFAAVMRLSRGVPYLLTAHGGDIFSFRGSGLAARLKTFAMANSLLCTANSRATMEAMQKTAPRVPIRLIPMGVDTDLFRPERRDTELRRRYAATGPFLLGVGRFAGKKGFSYLLQAMPIILRKYPEARLVLVGFGPLEQSLKNLARDLNLQNAVIFPGSKTGVELAAHFASADVFIGPSIVTGEGDTEGQGVVFLEAMASGTAVIASDAGGITDIVRAEDTGLIVPQRDADAIAQQTQRLLGDDGLRQRLCANGLRLARDHYSWDAVAQSFLDVYARLAPAETGNFKV